MVGLKGGMQVIYTRSLRELGALLATNGEIILAGKLEMKLENQDK